MTADLIGGILGVLGPGAGGFLGTWFAWFWYCPNHRCCQLKRVHRVLENDQDKKET